MFATFDETNEAAIRETYREATATIAEKVAFEAPGLPYAFAPQGVLASASAASVPVPAAAVSICARSLVTAS